MPLRAIWFRESIDLHFDGDREGKYDDIITDFLKQGLIIEEDDNLHTTVKP
jgi:hypothetical protein